GRCGRVRRWPAATASSRRVPANRLRAVAAPRRPRGRVRHSGRNRGERRRGSGGGSGRRRGWTWGACFGTFPMIPVGGDPAFGKNVQACRSAGQGVRRRGRTGG